MENMYDADGLPIQNTKNYIELFGEWGGRTMESTKALVHAFAACNNWVSERTKVPENDMIQAMQKENGQQQRLLVI
ncbi:hypothetical protein [Virgibacillus sp.]|uniref:hypothetical protein n=1 Tax=Virgibacillus sp. TaxID=1872700 RepID=UPI0025D1096C|nr:hypothetical protein [Virgibacillus sp.]